MPTENRDPAELRRELEALSTWRSAHLRGDEKGEAQIFLDRLFRALGHTGLREAGATLEERIKRNDQRGTAFADLMWKPRVLIEMKKAGADLKRHYRQAFDYWVAAVPERPRYVVLCNFDEFWIYDFNIQMDEPVDRVNLSELGQRWESLAFLLPEEATPQFGNDLVAVTRDAASRVVRVFRNLIERGVERTKAQTFVLQCVMAMFSEDIGLLPSHLYASALDDAINARNSSDVAYDLVFGLFREMNTPGVTAGGRFKGTPYFNGGLFHDVSPLSLTQIELFALREAAFANWAAVRPEIFGTLFEQSMDAGERHAYGAHFTSQADIAKIVGPIIVTPWRERISEARTRGRGGIRAIEQLLADMYSFRVLDPACGSGNFLYVAYREMRRLEHEALTVMSEMRRSEGIAAQGAFAYVTTDHFFGLDVNKFAVEVAKVTMMLGKKLAADELEDDQAVLPLDNLDDTIRAADALFTPWPKANVVIGNPPYMGRRKMVEELGATYCERLRRAHPDVGGVSDFVTYWFPLTHRHLPSGGRGGLVATNTVRQNESRAASLDYVVDHEGVIFDAVSSQPWSGDAAVHVSIVNWAKGEDPKPKVLWLNNGQLRLELDHIPPSLSPDVDVRSAASLACNQRPNVCFQGQTPGVSKGFFVTDTTRRKLGRGAGQVVHPFVGGDELLKDLEVTKWIIDIPDDDLLDADTNYPGVMDHLRRHVLPVREQAAAREAARNDEVLAENPNAKPNQHHKAFLGTWWRLGYRREKMLTALQHHDRYIATSRVASEKRATVFEFVDANIRPGDSLTTFALSDDYSFGILSSSLHRHWLEARCSTLETRLRYTSTTVWDSYPWPQSPSSRDIKAICRIVADLLVLRETNRGRGLSLAQQYDALRVPGRSKLRALHAELDKAVHAAYGFSEADLPLAQLLALNLDIAEASSGVRRPGTRNEDDARVTDYRLHSPLRVVTS